MASIGEETFAPTLSSAGPSSSSSHNGTIHVKVLRARNLPTVDFGKRQEPCVVVSLEGSSPKSWGATDPSYVGGPLTPEWTAEQNREIELFYDASRHPTEAMVEFEVFADESGEALIGTGQLNIFNIAKNKVTDETEYIVQLKEGRGQLVVHAWWGPPVRRAFRAAQRASKLLDARDYVVTCLWSMGLKASAPAAAYLHGPMEYLKKNRRVSMALAAVLGVLCAGMAAIFLVIAVPTAAVAALTFPLWIIPFLVAMFFTAPLWIPVLLLVGMFLAFISAFLVGLGVTSRHVRRKGAMLTSRIKHSEVGKRVVYEKTA